MGVYRGNVIVLMLVVVKGYFDVVKVLIEFKVLFDKRGGFLVL